MKIKNILKKGLTAAATVMTLDQWIQYRVSDPRRLAQRAGLEEQFNALQKAHSELNHQATVTRENQRLIEGRAASANEHITKYLQQDERFKEVEELYKISVENNSIEKSEILRRLEHEGAILDQLEKKVLAEHLDLYEMIKRHAYSSSFFLRKKRQSDGSLTNQSAQASSSELSNSQTTDSTLNSIAKGNNSPNTTFEPANADESSVLGAFSEFKEFLSKELSQLTGEELGLLSNALGFILVFSFFTTVVFIIIGESIIKYFKLELKFPKLAKIIKIRSTFNVYYLIFNIIIIYSILIFFICINLYMFLTGP